jgi:hypothetical protein
MGQARTSRCLLLEYTRTMRDFFFGGHGLRRLFLLLCDMIQVERQKKHLATSTALDLRDSAC